MQYPSIDHSGERGKWRAWKVASVVSGERGKW